MRETSRLRHSGQKVASGGKCTAALGGSMILPHMLQRVMLVSLSDMASLSWSCAGEKKGGPQAAPRHVRKNRLLEATVLVRVRSVGVKRAVDAI